MKTLTVFTPTYNRAHTLPRGYEALKRQTCKDFKWLIIDDGSTDNTKKLVDSWIAESIIEIEYYYKENGGMHTAHNKAYELIDTELNVCIDSDDYMTDDAVELIIKFWEEKRNKKCGGIYALDIDPNGKIIGEKFPDDLREFKGWGCKIILYGENNKKKVKITGDKKFIGVTEIIKKYPPIPVFEGEKYYSLYYKQHLIEHDYTILILNKPICVVEYLPEGSSYTMFRQYLKNPKGFQHLRLWMIENAPLFKLKFCQAIHYVNSSLILRDKYFLKRTKKKNLVIMAIPLGFILHLYTLYQNNKLKKR